jgi:hypothetical protein
VVPDGGVAVGREFDEPRRDHVAPHEPERAHDPGHDVFVPLVAQQFGEIVDGSPLILLHFPDQPDAEDPHGRVGTPGQVLADAQELELGRIANGRGQQVMRTVELGLELLVLLEQQRIDELLG